jgi:Xaa-Pro aminopeptidase
LEDVEAVRRRLYREKRAQLEQHLEVPVLLYWGKWEGPNIRALTLAEDFTRPTFLLCIPGGETVAFAQQIETDELRPLAEELDIHAYGPVSELKELLTAHVGKFDEVAVEASRDFFGLDRLPPHYYEFVSSLATVRSADDILLPFRSVKSPTELALMKAACLVTMPVFDELERRVVPGVAEAELLDFLLHHTIDVADGTAFPPFVASGPRSQHPHPQRRSARKVETGDRVVVDYGVSYRGYKSDVTRTFIAGGDPESDPYYEISVKLIEILRGMDLSEATPYDVGREVAAAVRDAGLSDRERHGYGHGLGVETHDPHPYIVGVPMPWTDRRFEDGMVFTFEPGFYDDTGGFRLEDDYVVLGGRAVPMQEFELPT